MKALVTIFASLFFIQSAIGQLTFTTSVSGTGCSDRIVTVNVSGGSGNYLISMTPVGGGTGQSQSVSGSPTTSVPFNLTLSGNVAFYKYSTVVFDLTNPVTPIPAEFVISPKRTGTLNQQFSNVFTPNGDGVNDFFYPTTPGNTSIDQILNVYRVEFQILDASGTIWYQDTKDIQSQTNHEYAFIRSGSVSWDGNTAWYPGTPGPSPAPNGTYFYAYKFFNCDNPSGKIVNGYVMVLR